MPHSNQQRDPALPPHSTNAGFPGLLQRQVDAVGPPYGQQVCCIASQYEDDVLAEEIVSNVTHRAAEQLQVGGLAARGREVAVESEEIVWGITGGGGNAAYLWPVLARLETGHSCVAGAFRPRPVWFLRMRQYAFLPCSPHFASQAANRCAVTGEYHTTVNRRAGGGAGLQVQHEPQHEVSWFVQAFVLNQGAWWVLPEVASRWGRRAPRSPPSRASGQASISGQGERPIRLRMHPVGSCSGRAG